MIHCRKPKNWLADARYEERHNLIIADPNMTVDKWFSYWIENIDDSMLKAVHQFETAYA